MEKDVDNFLDMGIVSDKFDDELGGIEMCLMTEDRGESPHAVMMRESIRARASSREWLSSTARLEQNLAAFDKFGEVETEAFARSYKRCKSSLPRHPKLVRRSVKMRMSSALQQVYRSKFDVAVFVSCLKAE